MSTDDPFFQDATTGAPCPRDGDRLCTMQTPEHLHRMIPKARTYARPQAEALRAAVAAREPAAHPEALTPERYALEHLAMRLEELHADLLRGGQSAAYRAQVGLSHLEDLRDGARLARAAAVHGYPRPALEQLGRAAAQIPGARTTDPGTSHDAARSTPQAKRGNQLGRLLVGFAAFERVAEVVVAQGADFDATLTSEELAHRLDVTETEYAKRCSELLALGYIRIARDTNGHERTRQGASGRQRLVFELTDDGRVKARELGSGR